MHIPEGLQYRSKTGVDSKHQGGDSRENRPPKGGAKGAHTSPQDPSQTAEHQQEVCLCSSQINITRFITQYEVYNRCVWLFREATEDADSQGDASSQPDTISIASRTSQNTVDSDKVEQHIQIQQKTSH